MIERQGDLRIHQGDPFKFIDDIPELRLVRLQEFATRRDIKEKILDRKYTPLVTSIRLDAFQVGTGKDKMRTQLRSL